MVLITPYMAFLSTWRQISTARISTFTDETLQKKQQGLVKVVPHRNVYAPIGISFKEERSNCNYCINIY